MRQTGFPSGLLLAVAVAALGAQTPPPGGRATRSGFEAASVKPVGPDVPRVATGMRGGPGTSDPGRITYTSVTLAQLLVRAYDVWPDQISGPSWL